MSFESLLEAVDQYIATWIETGERGTDRTCDWDCGLAMEFESSLARAEQSQKRSAAASNLEKVLNTYIDERVQAALCSRSSQGG